MALLKNTGKSPRGVHDIHGRCVVVEPGEFKSVKISDDQAAVLTRMGALLVLEDCSDPKPNTLNIAPISKDVIFNGESIKEFANTIVTNSEPEDLTQLRKDAEDLGIKVDGRWGSERLQTEIDNALRSTDSDRVQD